MVSKLLKWVQMHLPQSCALCLHTLHQQEHVLCDACFDAQYEKQNYCLHCHRPVEHDSGGFCAACQGETNKQVRIYACQHQTALGSGVRKIKAQRQFYWLEPLCEMLYQRVMTLQKQQIIEPAQALLPVPLHDTCLRQRGFNQAYLIAQQLGRRLNLPVVSDALIRTRHTPSQQFLNRKERQMNLQGAFQLKHDLDVQRIAIIDDVFTTGATTDQVMACLPDYACQVWTLSKA